MATLLVGKRGVSVLQVPLGWVGSGNSPKPLHRNFFGTGRLPCQIVNRLESEGAFAFQPRTSNARANAGGAHSQSSLAVFATQCCGHPLASECPVERQWANPWKPKRRTGKDWKEALLWEQDMDALAYIGPAIVVGIVFIALCSIGLWELAFWLFS